MINLSCFSLKQVLFGCPPTPWFKWCEHLPQYASFLPLYIHIWYLWLKLIVNVFTPIPQSCWEFASKYLNNWATGQWLGLWVTSTIWWNTFLTLVVIFTQLSRIQILRSYMVLHTTRTMGTFVSAHVEYLSSSWLDSVPGATAARPASRWWRTSRNSSTHE